MRHSNLKFPMACLLLFVVVWGAAICSAGGVVGFSKVDITPQTSLRLSGYASRNESSDGVRDSLNVRAMAISPEPVNGGLVNPKTLVLVSVDSILVTSELTVATAKWLRETYGLARSQLVISSTHSHAAPHLDGGLENLFRIASNEKQAAATQAYTQRVESAIRDAIKRALETQVPGELVVSEASATFAVNRRLLDADGKWSGFGVEQDGLRDHRVRLLRAQTASGEILGGAYMYACHCTTLGGDFNKVSGDWAGLSASKLEQIHAGAIFLPIIGCGANANPEPRGTYKHALAHGAEMVDAVNKAIRIDGEKLEGAPVAHFGYAALASEHPTPEEIEQQLTADRSNDRRWAEKMKETSREMGRLPESYPMPIHTWSFGETLTWVFLGGEVVAEYQFLIEKELASKNTWVAAYCDDVFAYVASENMLPEGGYEVDYSMYYYLQPGRWRSGTQALILQRINEIQRGIQVERPPFSAEQALGRLRVPDGFRVELVASEPLVQDPVNVAIGTDGVVWVVEMGDYPLGNGTGGRVRKLVDSDGDGRLDAGTVFLDGLSYPTSVVTHHDGIIVIAAPDILFARDTNGDGVADEKRVLLTGLAESNPQHRASGFERGLDGRLHFGVGHGTKTLRDVERGTDYRVAGRDVAWNPITGEIEVTSGDTQFVRTRDAFGNWFGNSNSRPIFHYAIEERYQGEVRARSTQDLLTPAVAPPVRPRSEELARFNDLYAHRRFTSACSSIISRELSGDFAGTAFVCEPVHNLVARLTLSANDASFTAQRHADDEVYDFLTSTDQMFRPVRIVDAPDGSLWVVDMARSVIEHPEWIPMAWQQRIDLRAGSQLGRIYRVVRSDCDTRSLPNFKEDIDSAIAGLEHNNGAVRDLAAQAVCESGLDLQDQVRPMLGNRSAEIRAAALGSLQQNGWLTAHDCVQALQDSDSRVVRYAILAAERMVISGDNSKILRDALLKVTRSTAFEVQMQWLLSASRIGDESWADGVADIAASAVKRRWIMQAVSLQREPTLAAVAAEAILSAVDADEQGVTPEDFDELQQLIRGLLDRIGGSKRKRIVDTFLQNAGDVKTELQASHLLVLAAAAQRASRWEISDAIQPTIDLALNKLSAVETPDSEKEVLVNLLGSSLVDDAAALATVEKILNSANSSDALKLRAMESLQRNRSASVANLVLRGWEEYSNSMRASAGRLLLSRSAWVRQFVEALEAGTLSPADVDLGSLDRLRLYGDRELRMRSLKVLGKPNDRTKVVGDYLLKMPAPKVSESSIAAGKKLFDQHCATCHTALPGKSVAIGPPLENLKHWTIEQWVTAVLSPNQQVEPKYMQAQLLTASGRVYSAIVLEESPTQITLAQSDGKTETVDPDEVVDRRSLRMSLMPDGFEAKFTPEQLAALLSFVRNR